MSDRYLGWKYWDQVGNCWQYIDLDEFYGSDEVDRPVTAGGVPNDYNHTEPDWPNLTIVDLLDSDHLKNNKNNTENEDLSLLKSLPSRAKSRRSVFQKVFAKNFFFKKKKKLSQKKRNLL